VGGVEDVRTDGVVLTRRLRDDVCRQRPRHRVVSARSEPRADYERTLTSCQAVVVSCLGGILGRD
jgi:hypothetical protein